MLWGERYNKIQFLNVKNMVDTEDMERDNEEENMKSDEDNTDDDIDNNEDDDDDKDDGCIVDLILVIDL